MHLDIANRSTASGAVVARSNKPEVRNPVLAYPSAARAASMPPEAREHEANAALDGGDDGLALQRRVVSEAREWLAPRGHVLIETSRRQASATAGILEASGFAASIVHDDEVDGTVAIGSLGDAPSPRVLYGG